MRSTASDMLGEMYELQLGVPKFGSIAADWGMANVTAEPGAPNVTPPSVDLVMTTWFALAPPTPT